MDWKILAKAKSVLAMNTRQSSNNSTDTSPIPHRIRQARTTAGMSQKQLGIAAGMDEFSASPRMNQYEQGRHTPTYQTLESIAKVLDIPLPFFYTRDDRLAEWILLIGKLSLKDSKKLMDAVHKSLANTSEK